MAVKENTTASVNFTVKQTLRISKTEAVTQIRISFHETAIIGCLSLLFLILLHSLGADEDKGEKNTPWKSKKKNVQKSGITHKEGDFVK